ncbi:pre-mRNA-splicing factor ATP-dependent RNA helicase PRP16, partial [Tanacetum coccineum]
LFNHDVNKDNEMNYEELEKAIVELKITEQDAGAFAKSMNTPACFRYIYDLMDINKMTDMLEPEESGVGGLQLPVKDRLVFRPSEALSGLKGEGTLFKNDIEPGFGNGLYNLILAASYGIVKGGREWRKNNSYV